ncbi:hypothetical protein Trydic_g12706 [Trypoxylus dichotomus]
MREQRRLRGGIGPAHLTADDATLLFPGIFQRHRANVKTNELVRVGSSAEKRPEALDRRLLDNEKVRHLKIEYSNSETVQGVSGWIQAYFYSGSTKQRHRAR